MCKLQVITFLVINAQQHQLKLELGIIERTPSMQSIFEIGYFCEWNFFLAFQIAFDRGGFEDINLKAHSHLLLLMPCSAISMKALGIDTCGNYCQETQLL
jgi:hypothetical protein